MNDWEGRVQLKLQKSGDAGCTEGMPHYGMTGGYKVLILKI